ncbi:MAG TPA: family 20 glycosylhydrolase [Alloprevotella sp.]|nr:family 20 glycosylhydrolase [Alloprevotella sp.]
MRKKQIFFGKVLFLFLLAFSSVSAMASDGNAQPRYRTLIPQPASVAPDPAGEVFTLTSRTTVGHDASLRAQALYLQDVLAASTGWDLPLTENVRKASVRLVIDTVKVTRPEGYRLEVTRKNVTVCGHDAAGVFYGIQTLLQLFPDKVYSRERQHDTAWEAPCVVIEDAPERPWRGMMLDVARYFFDKEFVKKYIDMMAMYKLNKLQFHFIDDSGWRLEIKKYPRLTEVGAWSGPDHQRLGGYYTQDDIREIIDYAAVRSVEVIPEIEFPAHILSAVVAYPWLSCTGQQHEVPGQHFISRDLLCVGKESSIRFLRDVLDETIALFPSKYINIGGDEAVYTRWESCPDCRKVMEREGLTKASQLQGYLTNMVAQMMKEKGRTVVGWEEIFMRGKVSTPVVGLIWHNVSDTIHATRNGHKAILTPATHTYLDFPESHTPGEVKAATWMPPISLEKIYSMDVNDYSAEQSTVLGVQGCLWSDQFIHGTVLQEIPYLDENRSERYAEYLTFPRLLALSEIAWKRQSERDFNDFRRRLRHHFAKLDAKDCGYRVPEPEVVSLKQTADGGFEYTLASPVEGAEIRYTTNGRYPTIHSPLYTTPVRVGEKADFCALTMVTPRHYSLPLREAPDYSAYKRYGEYTGQWKSLQIQPVGATRLRMECTGKISGNGNYEIAFVGTRGTNSLKVKDIKIFKRNEQVAEGKAVPDRTDDKTSVFSFAIDSFEAGTPFFVALTAEAVGGNDTEGLVFVGKLEK